MKIKHLEVYEIRIAKNGLDHRLKFADKRTAKEICDEIWRDRPDLFSYYGFREFRDVEMKSEKSESI